MARIKLLIGLMVAIVLVGVSYAVNRPSHLHQDMASSLGTITGRVLDAQGLPVSGAEVIALSDSGSMGRVPVAFTDEQGTFVLNRFLVPGTYTLSAAKEADGYAHTYLPLYSEGLTTSTRVTLGEQQTISDVTLHLGPKAARLTGRLLDASTNRPIKGLQNMQMILRRVDNPGNYYGTGPDIEGNFSILIPTVPFTLEVAAPGYENRTYGTDSAVNPVDSLKVNPGETKRLNIALRCRKQPQ